MKPLWLLACCLSAIPFVASQDPLSLLPACGQTCLIRALSGPFCALSDTSCQCVNTAFAANVTACVRELCTVKEALVTKNATSEACGVPTRDRSNSMEITVITLACISFWVVVFRLIVKARGKGSGFGWDDWTIFATKVFAGFGSGFVVATAQDGLGRDMYTLTPGQITAMFKVFYAMAIFYKITTSLNKISLLCFFLRIFPNPRFRRAVYIWIALTSCIGLAFALADTLQCRPISLFWNKWDGEHSGHCVSLADITWVHSSLNVVLDVGILVLPITQVIGLDMDRKKKIGVALMFGVGGFVTIVTALRLQSISVLEDTQNPSWDLFKIVMWSMIEIHVGILCACMPSLRILVSSLLPKFSSSRGGATVRTTIGSSGRPDKTSNFGTTSDSSGRASTLNRTHLSRESESESTFGLEAARKGSVERFEPKEPPFGYRPHTQPLRLSDLRTEYRGFAPPQERRDRAGDFV